MSDSRLFDEHSVSSNPSELLKQLDDLISEVRRAGDQRTATWQEALEGSEYEGCARNLGHYLALRHRDIRSLQRNLAILGLSSLGRLESHVLPALEATRASLAAVARENASERPSDDTFLAGDRCLEHRRTALFGDPSPKRPIALLITCPTEAADNPSFMQDLANREVEAIRINCAHDDPALWLQMIEHARAARTPSGRPLRIFMDVAGPKIRTGEVEGADDRVEPGDRFAIVAAGRLGAVPPDADLLKVECTLPEALTGSEIGQCVYYDDGKLGGIVDAVEPWGIVVRVDHGDSDGTRIKPEKGLNFPDADLRIDALTDKDRQDLRFVTRHADAIEYSFVRTAEDVRKLQEALAECREDWRSIALVLKIETRRAVENLPEIVVHAASRQPTAIMIARGDLAVELGFTRMAEMQEEILWLAEAAHLPVIWATQVLEHLVKKGTPSRGEMTDAAMAARAECVMLNKGPFLGEAIDELDTLFSRMSEHQHKKSAQLRALHSW
jgi:pyruvate kinase